MVRSTFFGFEASKTAIFANQKSLDIVGNNLANANTDGYTRQRVERESVYYSPSSSRLATSPVGSAGAGVRVLGVSQIRDPFVDKCYRDERSLASYYGKSTDILNDILDIFPEAAHITDASGLLGGMENLYKCLNNYIQNPTFESEANIVKSSFANIVNVLQQANKQLETVAQRQTSDLQTTINRTNELLHQIDNINKVIAADASISANSGYFSANELLDQRNMMLDELAGYCNINVIDQGDGTVNIEIGGELKLDKNGFDKLQMTQTPEGYVEVKWESNNDSAKFSAGSINAYIEVLNGRGINCTGIETPTQGIPYYRDRLDTFAAEFAKVANSTIPVNDGNGKPLLDANGDIVYKVLLGAKQADGTTNPNVPITAKNISISDEWNKNGAGYFIFSKEENVENYAQQLSYKLFEDKHKFESNGEKFEGTFSEYLTDMFGKIGTDVSFNLGRQKAAEAVTNKYLSQREAISGVQQDEETANMLIYQKSYQAAARMMTVMDELLDVIINQLARR